MTRGSRLWLLKRYPQASLLQQGRAGQSRAEQGRAGQQVVGVGALRAVRFVLTTLEDPRRFRQKAVQWEPTWGLRRAITNQEIVTPKSGSAGKVMRCSDGCRGG